MGFIEREVVPSNKALFIPNCDLYTFGTLTSSIHMAWVRTVAGRLESRYRYSKDIPFAQEYRVIFLNDFDLNDNGMSADINDWNEAVYGIFNLEYVISPKNL